MGKTKNYKSRMVQKYRKNNIVHIQGAHSNNINYKCYSNIYE